MDPLENPFWHALVTQPQFATGDEFAHRYLPDIDPIAALPDVPDAASWSALTGLIEEPAGINLLRLSYDIPEDWTLHYRLPVVQMVCESATGRPSRSSFEPLTPGDRPEMLALAISTRPGPYALNTPKLGDYIGVRQNGRIIAMAGIRIRIPGMTEVSSVCTDPNFRGQGLAAALTAELTARIFDCGEQPFLHAHAGNSGAIAIYERLGYRITRTLEHVVVSPPAN
jgi:ribosomal protein S18 acetylase RimI-like enzyme